MDVYNTSMEKDQEHYHTETLSEDEKRYRAIGLTPHEYTEAVEALQAHDTNTLDTLIKHSQDSIIAHEQNYPPSTQSRFFLPDSGQYKPERGRLHEELVNKALSGKSPQEQPIITILAGPPGAGKSYIKARMPAGTAVETDPDKMKASLFPGYDGLNPEHVASTHAESLDIAQMILDASMQKRLNVICESTFRAPEWVRGVITKAEEDDYQIDVTFLHKDLAQCFQDAFTRSERPVSLSFLLSSIRGYDTFKTLRAENAFTRVTLLDMQGPEPHDMSTNEEYAEKMFASLEAFRPLLNDL